MYIHIHKWGDGQENLPFNALLRWSRKIPYKIEKKMANSEKNKFTKTKHLFTYL